MQEPLNAYGIRLAKMKLSEIVRAAKRGTFSLVTDNKKVVAMIGPPPSPAAATPTSAAAEEPNRRSDAKAFRDALFAAPFPLPLEF